MGVKYFRGIWSCLRAHQQEWCQLCPIIYPLYALHLLTICTNSPFSPPPPLPTECAATNRVRTPLGLGGHAKSYDPISPQTPNEADTTMTTYPATDDLSINHRRWELPGNNPSFQKYGNLPLCLENYALFSLPPI